MGDERVQPPVSVAGAHRGVRLQPVEQGGVVDSTVSLVSPRCRAQADERARTPQARILPVDQSPTAYSSRPDWARRVR